MDPRLFLVLPEHVSNAHHTWNYALFVTQMSSLNGLDVNGMSGAQKKKATQKSLAAGSSDNAGESLHLLEALMNDLYVNELKQNYAKLNSEPILSILKIKKRNKASMFNLILPPAPAAANVQCLTGPELFASTTPWLAKQDTELVESELNKQDTESSSSSSSSSSSVEDKTEGKDLDDAESDYYEGCKR